MYGVNESAQREGTYKLLRITDIQNDSVDWNLVPYTNYSGIVEPYFLQKGDIVFARTGATVGKSFLIQSPPSRAIYASYLIRVRFVLPALAEYIKVFFGTPCYWSQITQKTVGTGQPNVNGTSLAGLLLPLPPLNEQKRIVSQVESLLKYIDEIDENAVSLENTISLTKQKILDLAIRGKLVPQDPNDEPASELLKKIKAEKETLIKSGKLKRDKHESFIFRGDDNCYYEQIDGKRTDITEDIPFDIPESWCWCRLSALCDYGSCQSLDAEVIPEDAWVLDLEDIEKETGRLLCRITKRDRPSASSKHVFRKGNVLYSKLRTYLNKVLIADQDGYCTSEILPLDFGKYVLPEYARSVLMSRMFLDYTAQCGYGVKMPRLGTEDGRKALFPLPPLREQARIVGSILSLKTILMSLQEQD